MRIDGVTQADISLENSYGAGVSVGKISPAEISEPSILD